MQSTQPWVRAGAAHFDQAPPERCARTVKADGGVVGRQPFLRATSEIGRSPSSTAVTMSAYSGLRSGRTAVTHVQTLSRSSGSKRRLGVALQIRSCVSALDSRPPVVVDDGVSKDSVEPRDDALLVSDLVEPCRCSWRTRLAGCPRRRRRSRRGGRRNSRNRRWCSARTWSRTLGALMGEAWHMTRRHVARVTVSRLGRLTVRARRLLRLQRESG